MKIPEYTPTAGKPFAEDSNAVIALEAMEFARQAFEAVKAGPDELNKLFGGIENPVLLIAKINSCIQTLQVLNEGIAMQVLKQVLLGREPAKGIEL